MQGAGDAKGGNEAGVMGGRVSNVESDGFLDEHLQVLVGANENVVWMLDGFQGSFLKGDNIDVVVFKIFE